MSKIGSVASEEKSFENVNGRQTKSVHNSSGELKRDLICKTLCPQLPDSNTVDSKHCLPMLVTTVQIYEISMLFYQKGNN